MSLSFHARLNTIESDSGGQLLIDTIAGGANVGLTADAGSSQGDGVITSSYNVYSTVATIGDAATLPATSVVGQLVYIKNDGANSMDVFPASGDDAGAGTDTAVAVAAGESKTFMATVADATWTELIIASGGGGGGDVTKVGTPVNNQLGVWTGDGTLEGDANLTWSGSVLQVGGTIQVSNSGGGSLVNEAASATNPTLLPDKSDTDTGIGQGSTDGLSLVAGGIEGLRLSEQNNTVFLKHQITTSITAFAGGGQGSATALESSYNIVATVATTGDSVRLTAGAAAVAGTTCYVKNDGANSMDVFPASGDNLGEGLDTALAVAAGESATFIGTAGSTWTELIAGGGGGGDVSKVGTPANNQLGVWTGDGTIEGDANLTFSGTILTNAGTNGQIRGSLTTSGAILNEAASATNPTLIPRRDDTSTGIGASAIRNLSVILDGDTAMTWQHSTAGDNSIRQFVRLTTGITASTTQTQGNGLINGSRYTEVTTVANTDDVITLHNSGIATFLITIMNTGANRLQIFPPSGDAILPNAVDASVFLDSNKSMTFYTVDGTNWMILAEPAAADGLVSADIGVTVQAFDADLDDIAALAPGDGEFITRSSGSWVASSGCKIAEFTVSTTDATLTDIANIGIPSDAVITATIRGHGFETATGDTISEVIHVSVKNDSGTSSLLGAASVAHSVKDAGASAWVFSITVDDSTDTMDIEVTGEAAHSIDWKVCVEWTEAQ